MAIRMRRTAQFDISMRRQSSTSNFVDYATSYLSYDNNWHLVCMVFRDFRTEIYVDGIYGGEFTNNGSLEPSGMTSSTLGSTAAGNLCRILGHFVLDRRMTVPEMLSTKAYYESTIV